MFHPLVSLDIIHAQSVDSVFPSTSHSRVNFKQFSLVHYFICKYVNVYLKKLRSHKKNHSTIIMCKNNLKEINILSNQ